MTRQGRAYSPPCARRSIKMAAPKIKVELEIPKELVAFLRIVSEEIDQGLINDESDDGIQIPEFTTFGGLWDKENAIYGFTHFLEPPPTNRYWEIQLDPATIASIASGERKILSGWQCAHEDCDNFYTEQEGYCRLCDAPQGREAQLKSEAEFSRTVEAFNKSHGEEFEKLRLERVKAIRTALEDPSNSGDIRKTLKVTRRIDDEYDKRIHDLFKSAGIE